MVNLTFHCLKASKDYLDLVSVQGKRWQKSLQREHDERLALQSMVEHLAKQHRNLEHQARSFVQLPDATSPQNKSISGEIWFKVCYLLSHGDDDDVGVEHQHKLM